MLLTPVDSPFALFADWLAEAEDAEPGLAHAMSLATARASGTPSLRMVLLKGADERGFVFYTNSGSRKIGEIAESGAAALCFHWKSVNRQVRIEGRVEQVGDAEADAYWTGRPRDAQIGAWASKQSQAYAERAQLEAEVADHERRFAGRPVPRPRLLDRLPRGAAAHRVLAAAAVAAARPSGLHACPARVDDAVALPLRQRPAPPPAT